MLAKTEHKDNVAQHTKYIIKSTIVYIAIMAVSLFGNSYFKVLAAANMDSALLYPLFQGSGLILSAIMARIFFKEKISVKKAIGMVLAFAALCMINL
jgi:multidrug transporter EmrE-like cation transporter